MSITPLIAVHMTAALTAVVTGPVALWARKGAVQRPKLHRAFGYAWVTLMLVAATSAIFIPASRGLPRIGSFGPLHLLVPFVYFSLFGAFWFLARGNIAGHRRTMQGLYIGACIVAGTFTLLPDRYLGQLVWSPVAALRETTSGSALRPLPPGPGSVDAETEPATSRTQHPGPASR